MNEDHSKLIEELYLEMYQGMIAYAASALEESLAEEAVQETFRVACQRAQVLAESENPRGWLVITLRNIIRNMKRSQEASQRIIAKFLVSQASNISIGENTISLDIVYQNVADLEEYKLLKEMVLEGRSHLEMANARGISVAACKKRVQRAKELLKNRISQ